MSGNRSWLGSSLAVKAHHNKPLKPISLLTSDDFQPVGAISDVILTTYHIPLHSTYAAMNQNRYLSILLVVLIATCAMADRSEAQSVVYVQNNGQTSGNGTSWETAYPTVQDAIQSLGSILFGGEIWVAAGVYYPNQCLLLDLICQDFLSFNFVSVLNGFELYGGFEGWETSRDQRDPQRNITVLSGDLGGDDVTDENGITWSHTDIVGTNNRVITLTSLVHPVVIDGFVITGGNATEGAGINMVLDTPLSGLLSAPLTLNNVIFAGNRASVNGGALRINSSLLLQFNSAEITNTVFTGNQALNGAAVYVGAQGILGLGASAAGARLENVLMHGNSATGSNGAAMYVETGGAVAASATVSVINSLFYGNTGTSAAIRAFNGGILGNSNTVSIRNSIFWNNGSSYITVGSAALPPNPSLPTSFSTFQTSIPSPVGNQGNNLTSDPQFINAAGSDFRLATGSPAIDSGANSFVTLDTDLAGLPRIQGDVVDRGPYEASGIRTVTIDIPGPDNPADECLGLGAGWQLFSAPVEGMDVEHLSTQNLVQGVPELRPNNDPNLFTYYTGTAPQHDDGSYWGWVPAASLGEVLEPGHGFIWYFFDVDFIDTNYPDTQAFCHPIQVSVTGRERERDVVLSLNRYSETEGNENDGFTAAGNAFAEPMLVSGVYARGGDIIDAVQIWNTETQTYEPLSISGGTDTIDPWIGFLVENFSDENGDTSLDADEIVIPYSARVLTGGSSGIEEPLMLSFHLAGIGLNGNALGDRVQMLFHEAATNGNDRFDASKLFPLAPQYVQIAFVGSWQENPRLLVQDGRPANPGSFSVPLVLYAANAEDELTLSWDYTGVFPAQWTVILEDKHTATEYDLRTAGNVQIDIDGNHAAAQEVSDMLASIESYSQTFLANRPPLAQRAAVDSGRDAAERFVLHVIAPPVSTDESSMSGRFAFESVYPNPAREVVTVSFELHERSEVRLEVFDLLGRRIAMLVDDEMTGGAHQLRWRPDGGIASGVYFIRLSAGEHVASRRVTLVR